MIRFVTKTLGEICDDVGGIIRTGPFGTQLHQSDYSKEGTPVIMPQNIVDGKVSDEDIARIRDEDVNRLLNHRLQVGDIVYGRRGDIGRRALITKNEEGWLCGTGSLRISLGGTVIDPIFLYYYLGQSRVINLIYNNAIGATLPNLNTSIIRRIPITYPTMPDQCKIASILSAYDDLIENNQRRIRILDDMAQMLYREWFVKFCFPGHEKIKIADSELGPIPEGWEVVNLADIVEFIRGVEPGSSSYIDFPKDGYIAFLRVGDLGDRKSNIFVPYTLVNNKILNKTDIALSLDGTIGIVRLGLVGAYSAGIRKIVIKNSTKISWTYLYCLLRSDYIQEIIKANAKGTTIIHAGSATKKMIIGLPPIALLECFESNTAPLLKLVLNLADKINILRQTRDLLLPKLISGELDVSNIDIKVVEAA